MRTIRILISAIGAAALAVSLFAFAPGLQASAAPKGKAAAVAPADPYRDGFRQGFRDGWADAKRDCHQHKRHAYGFAGPGRWARGYEDGYAQGYGRGTHVFCRHHRH